MTTEKFEQACEIKKNIDEAMDLKNLLGNFKITGFSLKLCTKKDNIMKNHVDTLPAELWVRLQQTCQRYIEEQQEIFKNL